MQFSNSIFVAFAALASFAAAAPTSQVEDVPSILAREAANGNLVKRCYISGNAKCAQCIQQYNLSCPFLGGASCSRGASKSYLQQSELRSMLIEYDRGRLSERWMLLSDKF
jgi:hypothetical protein